MQHFVCEFKIQSDGTLFFFKFFLQELYRECDKLRQTVCLFATESEDNDSSLGKNLSDLSRIIMSYIISFTVLTPEG